MKNKEQEQKIQKETKMLLGLLKGMNANLKNFKKSKSKSKKEEAYTLIIDTGKKSTIKVNGSNDLAVELQLCYNTIMSGKYARYDVKVYNHKEEDITESNLINKKISSILMGQQK